MDVRDVVPRVAVLAAVYDDGEEAADGPLEDGLLELGGEVGLNVEDGAEADVSLDLGRAGGADVAALVVGGLRDRPARGPAAAPRSRRRSAAVLVLVVCPPPPRPSSQIRTGNA